MAKKIFFVGGKRDTDKSPGVMKNTPMLAKSRSMPTFTATIKTSALPTAFAPMKLTEVKRRIMPVAKMLRHIPGASGKKVMA
ncbi:hypothetical protein BMS3Abin16_00083 [archaeon BMS3Abin16]|nr:hypothetical protein BMS3Abin16_00083 [archaeon BMS3Abin16]